MRGRLLGIVAVAGCAGPPCDRAWFPDGDGDGFGVGAATVACVAPQGHAPRGGDCDDGDPTIHPGAPEICDGVDQGCDGGVDEGLARTWHRDADGDGHGDAAVPIVHCEAPAGFVAPPGDCDDGDAGIHPGAPELCDGADNDCDGTVDDDPTNPTTHYRDGDADGFGTPTDPVAACVTPDGYAPVPGDCDDGDPDRHPGVPERCNGVDDDCDDEVDEQALDAWLWTFDGDGDGFGDPAAAAWGCDPPAPDWSDVGGDCDDSDPTVAPGAPELVGDERDSDCDGSELCYLDRDADGYGTPTQQWSLDVDCSDAHESTTDDDCDDDDPRESPGLDEIPYDNLDNDCDPSTPDDDLDGDGFNERHDCDDLDPAINPLSEKFLVEVGEEAGLDALHWDPETQPAQCGTERMAGGTAAGDFDGDGLVDLFFPRLYRDDVLLRNAGDGTFEDVTVSWGIAHTGTGNAALWVDVDADEDLDLYVAGIGADGNRLYVNQGTSFTDETAARGLDVLSAWTCGHASSLSAGDVNGDGWLDLLVTAWFAPEDGATDRARLFLNDGAGSFVDFTDASGIPLSVMPLLGSAIADIDLDGTLDIALAGDDLSSSIWWGQGDGTFVDGGVNAGPDAVLLGHGTALADVDGDADLDWLLSSVTADPSPCAWDCTGNRLFRNDGGRAFTEISIPSGLRDGGHGWGLTPVDLDADGRLDVVQANGVIGGAEVDLLRIYTHGDDGTWHDEGCGSGFDTPWPERGVLAMDLDDDGDQDLVTVRNAAALGALRNDSAAAGWLRVRLHDPGTGNPFGVGARIEAVLVGRSLHRPVQASGSSASSGPPEAFFGLDDHVGPLDVHVTWPDGAVQVLADVPGNQVLVVTAP